MNIGQARIYTDLPLYIDLANADGNRASQPDVGYVRGVMDDDLLHISVIKKFTDTGKEEKSDMNGISKTTMLLIIIIGVVVLTALVAIVALVVIMNGKKNARNVPPPQYRPVAFGAQPRMSAARENNGPMFKMTDISNGEVFSAAVGDSIIVGRRSDCDIILRDGQVSGHHMRITRAGGGFRASDLGSTNGTIINGAQISGETEINRGDLILLGAKEYRVE